MTWVVSFPIFEGPRCSAQVGQSKDTGTKQQKRQELVAWHEAGHAVMAALTPGYDPVAKVTIVPRSNGAGTDRGVPWPF